MYKTRIKEKWWFSQCGRTWLVCRKPSPNPSWTLLVWLNYNNLLHSYGTFSVLKVLYIEGGGDLLNHHQCAASTWMMWRQPYCARTPTTHQLTRGDRVMKPISVWGWLGGHDGQRPMGKFGQDAGVTPLLFFEGYPGIFNEIIHR